MNSKLLFSVLLAPALGACHSSSDHGVAGGLAPVVTNRGVAVDALVGTGTLRLVAASESASGRDLDGDGDTADSVVEILDLAAGTLVNTGLATPLVRGRLGEVVPPTDLMFCSDELAVFFVSETATGSDADHDGVPDEESMWVFNRRTGQLESLPFLANGFVLGGELASFSGSDDSGLSSTLHVFDVRDGSLNSRPIEPSALIASTGSVLAFARPESSGVDLNSDGDTADEYVLHLYDADTLQVLNTGWTVYSPPSSFTGDFLAFPVLESQQGQDLNRDGDLDDEVLVVVDCKSGRSTVPGIDVEYSVVDLGQSSDSVVVLASEQHGDLNGDGDTDDAVAEIYEPLTGRIVDTGVASFPFALSAGRWLGLTGLGTSGLRVFDRQTETVADPGVYGFWRLATGEHLLALAYELDSDLNGDGDRNDQVLVDWNARTHELRRGPAIADVAGAAGGSVLVLVSEPGEEKDLNGDGDQLDLVFALWDTATGTLQNLGLATEHTGSSLDASGHAAVLVSEAAQGADLNGDGDQLDDVLYTFSLPSSAR